jgi:endonuclease/exonuclease/phosphatase family metal-dependent hydrolase
MTIECIFILLTFIIRKVCSYKASAHSLVQERGSSGIVRVIYHLRFSYSRNSHSWYKLLRRYTFWGVSLNILLILVSNMSLLNPGPASQVSVFYQNVRGLIPWSELANPNPRLDTNKIYELQLYLDAEKPDVVILNETWLKPSIYSNEIIPDSTYKVFRLDRSKETHPRDLNNPTKYRANGGGVLVAVKQSLEVESKVIKIACKAEILAVELKLNSNTKICVGTCYRVGTLGESNRTEISSFLSNLLRVKKYSKFFMVGDINLPGISAANWDDDICSDSFEQEFIDMFNDFNMKQMIRKPTHNKGKILDLVLTNSPQHMCGLKIADENEICKSDHFPLHFNISEKIKHKKPPKRKLLNYKRAAWGPLNEEIGSTKWQSLLSDPDVERAHKVFETKLNELCNKHIPTVTTKSNYQPPWFDAEVHVKCREKEKWRKKFKQSKSDEHYMKYSACRKEVTKLIELKANANFEDEHHKNAVTKKFWTYVKATTNSSRIPETVYYNNVFRSKPKEQANLFNQYFADQFSSPSNYDIDIDYSVDFSVDFHGTIICDHLRNLNVNKAPGPDNFHGKLLKNCAVSIARPLSILFEKSYRSGVIPKKWKLANVVPVYKKGTKNNTENYRPISLTSIIMKTYEKIIRDQLMSRCNDKISENQHGFLPSKSCETQLVPFYDDLALTLNGCSTTHVVYFDFAKAFDSVNHDIILDKLNYINLI